MLWNIQDVEFETMANKTECGFILLATLMVTMSNILTKRKLY
jgi:hypothetical protein